MQPAAVSQFFAALRFRYEGFYRFIREFLANTPSHDIFSSSISLDTPDNAHIHIGCNRIP